MMRYQVRTDDMVGTQGSSSNWEKDPKVLSGGEKSLSTTCLLLSLWEAISCPIRCLGTPPRLHTDFTLTLRSDEFDVYMDAINRRTSVQMLVRPSRCTETRIADK